MKKILTFCILSVLTLGPSIAPTLAAPSRAGGVVTLQPVAELDVVAGGSAVLELRIDVAPGYHIQAETPENEYSPQPIPDDDGFSVVRVEADGDQRLWRFGPAGGCSIRSGAN